MKTLPLSEARAQFSALVEDASRGEHTVVSYHGNPRAVLVSPEEFEDLQAMQAFAEHRAARVRGENNAKPLDEFKQELFGGDEHHQ